MEWFELIGLGGMITTFAIIRLKYGRNSAHHRYLREEVMLEKWSREKKINRD